MMKYFAALIVLIIVGFLWIVGLYLVLKPQPVTPEKHIGLTPLQIFREEHPDIIERALITVHGTPEPSPTPEKPSIEIHP
jgi:hypothetical protein